MGDTPNCGTNIIGLDLDILGEKVELRVGVAEGESKLADIVPLARVLCTKIMDVVLQQAHRDGSHIPCRKNCSACCNRCLVPLSVPEAFRLQEDISAAPTHRRESIRRTSLRAARLILSQELPEPFVGQAAEAPPASSGDLALLSDWYGSFRLACPFLRGGACTIYEQRPLACREHFVKGSAEACGGQGGIAEVLEVPVQLPHALGQLASELEGTSVEGVILPLALVWCEENQERGERTWPSAMMVNRFLEIVKAMASKNSPAYVV